MQKRQDTYSRDIELQNQSSSNFSIDDDDNDGFDDDVVFHDGNNENPDIDYYPGMSRSGRHTALGEPEDFKTKFNKWRKSIAIAAQSRNTRKGIIGFGGVIMIFFFFVFLGYAGRNEKLGKGSDSDSGSNLLQASSGDNDNNADSGDNGDVGNSGEYADLKKMSLDNMRNGDFWVYNYDIEFIDIETDDSSNSKKSVDSDNFLEIRDHHDADDSENDNSEGSGDDNDNKDNEENKDNENNKDNEDNEDNMENNDNKENNENNENNDNNDNKVENNEKIKDTETDEVEASKENEEAETKEDEKKNELEKPNNPDQGYYIHHEGSTIILKKASDSSYQKRIIDLDSLTYNGVQLKCSLVSINSKLDTMLVLNGKHSQWRHSSVARYWLVDINALEVKPVLTIEDSKTKQMSVAPISFAAFSPSFTYIYFVYENNIYLRNLESDKITQVTKDGTPENIFNGKPDWMYEEEVLGTDRAIYWASDDSKFSFIKWDDTDVPIYDLEFFHDTKYPTIEKLKYTKPGFKNPKLTLNIYNVKKGKLQEIKQPDQSTDANINGIGEDFIIYQVAWLNNQELLFKKTDRTSRRVNVCVFDSDSKKAEIIRNYDTAAYNGWYKNNGDIFVLPENKGYIDTIVVDGHDHLGYYKSSKTIEPDLLSLGNWDVIGGVVGYNPIEETIYFIGTSGNSMQRQIYKSSLKDSVLAALTDLTDIHSYSLKLSKGGKFGVMSYNGPDLPKQKIVNLDEYFQNKNYFDDEKNLNNAESIANTLEGFKIPFKFYSPIIIGDNITIDAVEVRPIDFDENKKYPLLVSVYGGPGIQKVNCDFSYGFEEIVSSSMDAIILYIDPRGTGGNGWNYQSYAKDNIGYWEPRDITEATQKYIQDNGFVDEERVAIWGWSYGGFTTLKTLEFDHGNTFKFGMAVAPVTNWLLYDSIYTERYMGLPKNNEKYEDAKINKIENFKDIYRFLIMHGTGDDNVHFQNTLQLLNALDLEGVENYDMHIFPDSDHSISHDNANKIVYDKLYSWLFTAFDL